MQKQILVVCVQLYPTSRRFEASCQIPALAYFRVLRVLSHLDRGKLTTVHFDYLQCVREKKVLWYRYPLYLLRNWR